MKKELATLLACMMIGQSSLHAAGCYDSTLIATAYYSPLPDQTHYTMGSFEAEKRLQGNGIAGASGRPVFDGMIAASPNYDFGTQITIEGRGVGQVEDRGGAIVESGQRGYNHDRIDIRMGYGDTGMKRAMTWGKKTIKATICPKNTHPEYALGAGIPTNTTIAPGHRSAGTIKVQKLLIAEGYLDRKRPTGYFGPQTRQAICTYQTRYNIIPENQECGTYNKQTASYMRSNDTSIKEKKEEIESAPFVINSTSEEIKKLQETLHHEGYYDHPYTGIYDQNTHQARLLQKKIIAIATEHLTQG